jgi:hypothetical protein
MNSLMLGINVSAAVRVEAGYMDLTGGRPILEDLPVNLGIPKSSTSNPLPGAAIVSIHVNNNHHDGL